MRLFRISLFLFVLLNMSNLNAQCPYNNSFYIDMTPAGPGQTVSDICVFGSDYVTVNVVAGETYIFSMCGNLGFDDPVLTLYNSAGTTILDFNDDFCGLYPEITWVATFTGTVHLLIDELGCVDNITCMELTVTWVGPCPADVGTFVIAENGLATASPIYLCRSNGGDCFDLTSNDDYVLPTPVAGEVSEVMYALYTCPPTIGLEPDLDPCFSTLFWTGEDFSDCNNAGSTILGAGLGQSVWFVPVTCDDSDNNFNPNGVINYDNNNDGCYDMGEPIEVHYLNLTAWSGTMNPCTGTATITITGGLPEFDGSNYVVTNTGPGNLEGTPVTHNGSVTVSNLSNGDVVTLDITDNEGCVVSVSYGPVASTSPSISGNMPICVDATLQLSGSGTPAAVNPWVSGTPGVASVTNTGLVTGISAGTTDITYTDNNNCFTSVTVTVNALPTVNAINNTPICAGELLTLTEDGGSGTGWNWTSLNGSGTFTAGTSSTTDVSGAVNGETFQVVVTDVNGCQDSMTTTVTINPLPAVNAINDGPICVGQTVTLTENGGDGTSWSWTSTNGSATINTPAGAVTTVDGAVNGEIFQVVVTDGNGCQDSTTTTVTVNPLPTFNISGSNDPSACGLSDGDFSIGGLDPNTNYSITFDDDGVTVGPNGIVTDGSGNYTEPGLNAGSYTNIIIQDANGCSTTAGPVSLTDPSAPSFTITNTDPTTCGGTEGTITISGLLPSSNYNISYTDDGVVTGPIAITSDASGEYTFTGLDAGSYASFIADFSGCAGSNPGPITLTDPTPAAFSASNTGPYCQGDPISVTEDSGSGVSWDWVSDGSATIILTTDQTPTVTGAVDGETFTVTATDANNCVGMAQTTVTIVANPTLDPIADVTECGSYDLPVTITGTDLTGGQNYYDDTQANGGNVISGTLTTSQTVYVFDGVGSCQDEISFNVTINPLPSVTSVTGGGSYCPGDPVNDILVDVTGTTDWTIDYTLDGVSQSINGSSSPISLGNSPGVYVITGVTDVNCTNTASGTQTITVNPIPAAPNAGTDAEYCSTEDFMEMLASGSGGILTWYSDANQTSIIGTGSTLLPANSTGTTTYYVTETLAGCEGEASMVVITVNDCAFIIPTAFTPDGDFTNEDWEIVGIDNAYPNNQVYVYNRWGDLLFESDQGDYDSRRWDGTINGKKLPVGSYYFIIEYNNENEDSEKGTVSIIR